jgi:hypothetical protein
MHWVDSTLRTKLTYIKIKVVLINVLLLLGDGARKEVVAYS